jgi:hypothetical protein
MNGMEHKLVKSSASYICSNCNGYLHFIVFNQILLMKCNTMSEKWCLILYVQYRITQDMRVVGIMLKYAIVYDSS